jgi:hypothetical protein
MAPSMSIRRLRLVATLASFTGALSLVDALLGRSGDAHWHRHAAEAVVSTALLLFFLWRAGQAAPTA